MIKSDCPEPQFERAGYILLNGKWHIEFTPADGGEKRSGEIEVPFCPESRLSGIGYTGKIAECEYSRTFSVAAASGGERILLRFGAVDYEAEVFLNGKCAGRHRGGYTPFCLDVTPLVRGGENALVVRVRDGMDRIQPSGKQSRRDGSYGCFYTRTTGIWQTVWLERTPADYIKSVKYFPDVKNGTVTVELNVEGESTADITVLYEGREVGRAGGEAKGKKAFTVPLKEKHLWEPGRGRLYDVRLAFGGDRVSSYFGLREVGYDGYNFTVNGKTVFQRFVMDQGYYPDGIYTARGDNEMEEDIDRCVALGFNGARLHQKVFEPRFLYHCDRKGFMVWGEFPSWGASYDDLGALGAVAGEWAEAVERDINRPGIVTWCPLNETWCDPGDARKVRDVRFVDAMYALTKIIDPTRPCVDVSGGFHGHRTDLYDVHDYYGYDELKAHLDALMKEDALTMKFVYAPAWAGEDGALRYKAGQPVSVSEFGGIAFSGEPSESGQSRSEVACAVESTKEWGYSTAKDEREFVEKYEKLAGALLACPKLSGFCYTQLYDIEQETNGFYTFDRKSKLGKREADRIRKCNLAAAAIERR